jgi:hypothetical protein
MDQHDRRTRRIARPYINDVERRAGNLDHLTSRGIDTLHGHDTGLGDQRQHQQRNHENDWCH